MELYQLEHFVAVVEERSFTRAAERVFRTQGAVSMSVRKLEEELGVPLMVRDSHECALTEAGQALLSYARQMIHLRNRMGQTMGDFRNLNAGCVRIASHESAAEYLLPAPLAAFYAQHQDIRLDGRLCDGHDIAHLVSEREVDLGFGIRQTSVHGLRSEVVHNDPLVVVAAANHPFGRRRSVPITELVSERFFVHSRHSPMVQRVQSLFAQHNVPLTVAARLWSFHTIKRFVRNGGGLAVLPASVVQADVEEGRVITIPVPELNVSRPIEITYRDKEPLLPGPAALLELLRGWTWGRTVQPPEQAAEDLGRERESPFQPHWTSGPKRLRRARSERHQSRSLTD
jgi:DNA-binding transcriptional LysR family regulator